MVDEPSIKVKISPNPNKIDLFSQLHQYKKNVKVKIRHLLSFLQKYSYKAEK